MTDSREHQDLRLEAVQELRAAIGFEQWCWPIADPSSLVATSTLAEVNTSYFAALPQLILHEESGYDFNTKRTTTRGGRFAAALSAVTNGDLARSPRWDECMRPYGIGDELTAACLDAHGCWGWMIPHRTSDDQPFSDQDAALLSDLAPTLGALARRAALAPSNNRGSRDELPPGVVILGEELHQTGRTHAASLWLDQLGVFSDLALCVIAARLLGDRHGTCGRSSARARLRTPSGTWAVFDGAFLEGDEHRQIAITVRPATSDEVLDILCHAHDLTPRQTELARSVANGLDTQQIAERLYISPHTVKDHLKAIFKAVGVGTRGELVSQLTGRHASAEPESPLAG